MYSKFATKTQDVPAWYKRHQYGGPEEGDFLSGVSVNLNEETAHLTINGERTTQANRPLSISWTSSTKKLDWKSKTRNFRGNISTTHGVCNLTLSFKGSGRWRGSRDTVNHPNQLGLDFSFDSYFTPTTSAEDASFWDVLLGKQKSVPDEYRNIQVEVPKLTLDLKPLDYFLITNLLLPGQHVFKADDPAPSSTSTQSGLAMPRDTILTGEIMQSKALNSKRIAAMNSHREFTGQGIIPPTQASESYIAGLEELIKEKDLKLEIEKEAIKKLAEETAKRKVEFQKEKGELEHVEGRKRELLDKAGKHGNREHS